MLGGPVCDGGENSLPLSRDPCGVALGTAWPCCSPVLTRGCLGRLAAAPIEQPQNYPVLTVGWGAVLSLWQVLI